jgi:DNA-binding transcriptional LysR family regulator
VALTELRAFYVASLLGSITKAANALNTSQPTISRQIGSLEKELGTGLIVHGHRPLRLTGAGEALFDLAGAFLKAIEALDAVPPFNDYEAQVTVVATPTVASHNLVDAIARFTSDHPRWSVQMIAENPIDGLSLIQTGYADVGVLPDPGIPYRFDFIELSETPLVVIAPLNHAVGELPLPLELAQVISFPLILLRQGSATRTAIDSALRRLNLSGHPSIEVEGVEAIKRLIQQTQSVSIVPTRGLTDEDYECFTIVPMSHLFQPLKSGIVTLRDQPINRVVEAFIDNLKDSSWLSRS